MPKDNYQFLVGWLKALPANIPKFVAVDAIKLFSQKTPSMKLSTETTFQESSQGYLRAVTLHIADKGFL